MTTTNTRNRKAMRHLIGTGLRAALTGAGLPVVTVFDEATDAWQQQAPVVMVVTTGGHRGPRYQGTGALISGTNVNIVIIVPDSDLSATPPYTAAMSEDTLDDIEKIVSDWIGSNPRSAEWDALNRTGDSQIDKIVLGKAYRQEIIPLQALPVKDVGT